jgi:signal transduction histidine kinase
MNMGDKCRPSQCCPGKSHHQKIHAKLHRIKDARDCCHPKEFQRFRSFFRYFRPAALLVNILILYLLFHWVGIKAIGILFAGIIVLKEIIQLLFIRGFQRRIFVPIEELKKGVDEIAKGNYNVSVDYFIPNDVGVLIASFNEMAEKLQESEQLKAEYEENRKNFIANISHDLKTPVTTIQGYIEAILDGTANTPEKRDQYLKTINRNTVYINNLINDLVLFSQLDLQKLDFHFETVSIAGFMNDLIEEYRFDLSEHKVLLEYDLQLTGNLSAGLDRKRFRQAVNNIINNAVKYGPDKDLCIRISLYSKEKTVFLEIRDNGPGIPEEKLPHIFNRFYRVDTERTKDVESTGLGLAIARELIQAHGGEISVSSVEGEGSCFTISIPVVEIHEGGVNQ